LEGSIQQGKQETSCLRMIYIYILNGKKNLSGDKISIPSESEKA